MNNTADTQWIATTGVLLLLCALVSQDSLAQNLTVGDDVGNDQIAFAFAPYNWVADLGKVSYRNHVSSGPGTGQQYGYIEYVQAVAPGLAPPTATTVAQFYTLIHDETDFLGTLLIMTHGGENRIAIEPFAKTPAGLAARNARYDSYTSGTTGIPGLPQFTAAEIYKSDNAQSYAVGVTGDFIRNHGRLTQGLVFIAACDGGTLTDDFVAGNARVSVGHGGRVTTLQQGVRVSTFFRRMDGKEGQAKRPVSAARAGLSLTASGQENTTLAPSVLTLTAPCPIKIGDTVIYTLDTTCEVGITPDIVCTGCTIENEVWLNNTTLRGDCTAPPPPGSFAFSLTLVWGDTYSDQNIARLDGNTTPAGRNAEGPAHDDYVKDYYCPQVDSDMDGFQDGVDNCPSIPNSGQSDGDGDGFGDDCDPCPSDEFNDIDSDGSCADADNCAFDSNATQDDSDMDGVGDVCDNCPTHPNPGQTSVVFGQTIVASSKLAFSWSSPADIEYVKGPLSDVHNYGITSSALADATNAISTAGPAPPPGVGFYYLTRLAGDCAGSWQTVLGAEPGRDLAFPVDDFAEGACCVPVGTCTEVTLEGCITRGGTYQGEGTICAQALECPAELAYQSTDPLVATNIIVTSTLTPAFTKAAGDVTDATVNWASLSHSGGFTTNCTKVSLRTPNSTEVILKDFAVAAANPYNVLSVYQGPHGGPGTYSIVLQESAGGGGCAGGIATLTGTTMTIGF